MASPRKALVIGEDTRSFLATVRSLGRGGIEVHAAPFTFQSPALRSRYISKTALAAILSWGWLGMASGI